MRKREKTYLPDASTFPAGVPSEVVAAVRALYEACSTRRATWPLNACTDCCMDEKLAREMCDWDLRSLTAKHIYEYQDAAHDREQDADEYLHFLPKVAELISHGDTGLVRHSTEIALQRLGGFDHALLSPSEKQAIEHWALALWQWWLEAEPASKQHFPLWYEDAESMLLMFAKAGLTIHPFLQRWQHCHSAWAAVQFGVLLARLDSCGGQLRGFGDDCQWLGAVLQTWAFSNEAYMHFASIWERMSDDEARTMLSGCIYDEASVLEQLGPRVPS